MQWICIRIHLWLLSIALGAILKIIMTQKTSLESRLKPPTELKSVAEKKIFNALVGAYSGDFFNIADMPLLVNYVRIKMSADRLYKEVYKTGEVVFDKNGNQVPSPFFKAYNTACGTMAVLSQKLRLAPSARMRQEQPGSSSKKKRGNKDFEPGGDWRDYQT